MAQYDTGLGWSAKNEWLIQAAPSVIGYLNTIEGGTDLPVAATATDLVLNGLMEARWTSGSREYALFWGKDGQDKVIVTGYHASTADWIYFVSATNTTRICRVEANLTQGTTGSVGTYTLSYNSTHGVYTHVISEPLNRVTSAITLYNSANEMWQAINLVQKYFTKIEQGYAVSCVAQWITPEGNTLNSPVLISSIPTATAISSDGTTPDPNLTSFDFLKDGVRFYMSLIPGITDKVIASGEEANLLQFGAALPSKIFSLIADNSFSNIVVITSPDPYGGNSEEDGGEQDDPEDEPVEEETMPIPAVVGLGFSTIYVPTQADLYGLAGYLWGGNLDLDNFLKLFANPMDSILGLSAVPLELSGTYEPIYLGGQLLQGVTLPRYTGRTAIKVDMGTVTISERWGAYLDYDPYTELAIYIPFVGIKNIKADDVMGKTIRLMYDIDILSGACIAYIRPEGGSPLYEWSGQCAMQIPITGANWDNIFSTAINTVATLGGALFAPASAPVLGGAVASAASQAIAAKPRIERSGAVNGITGFLGQLRPYIIRTIPEAYIPNDQNKFIGYPSYVSVNLGSLTGYNEIASIHLENIPATGDELAELESILKGGVIF